MYMFGRRWLPTTVLVVLAAAVCVRLGIWQLDRLEQRRAFNAHVWAMRALPALDLNQPFEGDLTAMEYRAVTAQGVFDLENQVALRNQYYQGQLGYHLLTPLRLPDGRAVLVDRGWIPAEGNQSPEGWKRYGPAGPVRVQGVIRLGVSRVPFGGRADPTLAPGQSRLEFWMLPNLERIATQMPYPILPVYIQMDPVEGDQEPPIPVRTEVELTEGPHLGYAVQWFTFAGLLLFGYPFLLRKRIKETG